MKNTEKNNGLEYYLQLDYPITIYRAEEGGYVAEIEDLPGCITEGETLDEVTQKIEPARRAWIEVAYEDGVEIPLPRTEQEYSGRFIVRIPKYLHRRLAEQAKREGVSLNQHVEAILSSGTSIHEAKMEALTAALEELKPLADLIKTQGCYSLLYSLVKWAHFEPEIEIEVPKLPKSELKELVAA